MKSKLNDELRRAIDLLGDEIGKMEAVDPAAAELLKKRRADLEAQVVGIEGGVKHKVKFLTSAERETVYQRDARYRRPTPAEPHVSIDLDERLRFYLSVVAHVARGPWASSFGDGDVAWRQQAHLLVASDLVDRIEELRQAAEAEAEIRKPATIAARGFQLPTVVGDVAAGSAIATAAELIGRVREIAEDLRPFVRQAEDSDITRQQWRNRVHDIRARVDRINADLFRAAEPDYTRLSPLAREIEMERGLVAARRGLTRKQAADSLGVSPGHVSRLIQAGKLAESFDDGEWLITAESFNREYRRRHSASSRDDGDEVPIDRRALAKIRAQKVAQDRPRKKS